MFHISRHLSLAFIIILLAKNCSTSRNSVCCALSLFQSKPTYASCLCSLQFCIKLACAALLLILLTFDRKLMQKLKEWKIVLMSGKISSFLMFTNHFHGRARALGSMGVCVYCLLVHVSNSGQLSLLPSAGRKMCTGQSAVTLCGWGVND